MSRGLVVVQAYGVNGYVIDLEVPLCRDQGQLAQALRRAYREVLPNG